jgi:protein-disulfide isomerase
MREIWFVLAFGIGLAAALPAAAQSPVPAKPNAAAAQNLLAVTKDDRVLGNPDAPITIIEYGSLTCPHCAHFADAVLPQLKKQWIDTGKARLVFRDFPLDAEALRAETVLRCAPPDRYYPLLEAFFANQDKWVTQKDWQGALQRLALVGGVSKKQFEACLADKKIENEVAQSRLTAATQLGVDATPTFFINGKKYEGEPTVEAMSQRLASLAQKS